MSTRGKEKCLQSHDELMRDAPLALFKATGLLARMFASAGDFLTFEKHHETACLISDVCVP